MVVRSHSAAACGSFKSSLLSNATGERESHSAAACGSFKSSLLSNATEESANPTARQRVDRSSPLYYLMLLESAKSLVEKKINEQRMGPIIGV